MWRRFSAVPLFTGLKVLDKNRYTYITNTSPADQPGVYWVLTVIGLTESVLPTSSKSMPQDRRLFGSRVTPPKDTLRPIHTPVARAGTLVLPEQSSVYGNTNHPERGGGGGTQPTLLAVHEYTQVRSSVTVFEVVTLGRQERGGLLHSTVMTVSMGTTFPLAYET
eukprot:Sspe_Gene.112979::Locus_96845_Transcript_1_1_Confidence_1.000_Length_643::g.112979::m.112979